jgi:hypothetical protein
MKDSRWKMAEKDSGWQMGNDEPEAIHGHLSTIRFDLPSGSLWRRVDGRAKG